ncbi:hypothetical protein EVG20_g800 [Dentipellis fragilis]|uniref:Uncharacterized protein n=1 Tax=Dentipellis fragilis TaxID=205917 RepID=A0A4Y9ZED9_9AGAM|nr:hypothetical protein EVG20_g800 [Dentipellis fragilis]
MTALEDADVFRSFLQEHFPAAKQTHPTEGRRKLKLRVLEEFWSLTPEQRAALPASQAIDAELLVYGDPHDDIAGPDVPAPGILVRTDFSDDAAWSAFYKTLLEAEKDFTSAQDDAEPTDAEMTPADEAGSSAPAPASGDAEMAENEDEDEEEEEPLGFFSVLDPEDLAEQARLTGISNLTALHMLNDASVRAAPPVPQGEKRVRPGNRLVDLNGLQEVYSGKTLWIYDAKSNSDQSVRMVNQQGDMYGTATGDSWRARASHITELQVNIASGAMKIDFGGMDRWDYPQRQRNLAEASQPINFSPDPKWIAD